MNQTREFIQNNSTQEVTKDNVEQLVYPANDGTSQKILEVMSSDQAIEDTVDLLRENFRKKKISLADFL